MHPRQRGCPQICPAWTRGNESRDGGAAAASRPAPGTPGAAAAASTVRVPDRVQRRLRRRQHHLRPHEGRGGRLRRLSPQARGAARLEPLVRDEPRRVRVDGAGRQGRRLRPLQRLLRRGLGARRGLLRRHARHERRQARALERDGLRGRDRRPLRGLRRRRRAHRARRAAASGEGRPPPLGRRGGQRHQHGAAVHARAHRRRARLPPRGQLRGLWGLPRLRGRRRGVVCGRRAPVGRGLRFDREDGLGGPRRQ